MRYAVLEPLDGGIVRLVKIVKSIQACHQEYKNNSMFFYAYELTYCTGVNLDRIPCIEGHGYYIFNYKGKWEIARGAYPNVDPYILMAAAKEFEKEIDSQFSESKNNEITLFY